MLDKQTVIDRIEVLASGQVQIRRAVRILEDGQELARHYHRAVLAPGGDLADQDSRVQAVCRAVWTPEVVAAYRATAGKAMEPGS